MKKSTGILLGVLGAVLVLVIAVVGWGVSAYNGLVDAEQQVHTQASQIETQLQRRSDLIPNLVNTVKGYAAHEEEIFTALADARAKLSGASSLEEMDEANGELTSALNRLMVVVENYPDLKANQNFVALQDELAGTENRITQARRDYNDAVQEYNVRVRRFPSNLIAGMFGFEQAALFESDEGASSVPEVSF
ncbi:MAG TPA: LemA family protein [Firmicutes bacterium]|nr:LemA family protein [Bacillota bacterium]